MDTSAPDIVSWIWPTPWILPAFLLGSLVCVAVSMVGPYIGLKRYQPAALVIAFGIFIGLIYVMFTGGDWGVVVAAFIWCTFVPPLAGLLILGFFSGVLFVWNWLGGK